MSRNSRNQSKSVPKQILKFLGGTPATICRYLPDALLEDYASVGIYGMDVSIKEIYVAYHSSSLNRLIWVSIPTSVVRGYEVQGLCLGLIDYMYYDIPNKEDKLILILETNKLYDFKELTYKSKAVIYMPKKKRKFRDISEEYFKRTDGRPMENPL